MKSKCGIHEFCKGKTQLRTIPIVVLDPQDSKDLLTDCGIRHKRSRSRGEGLSRHNSRSRRSSPTTLGGLVDKAQDKVESFLSPERAREKDDARRRRHRHEKGSRSLSRGRYSDSDSDDYYRRR